MTREDMAKLDTGDTVEYSDGRDGHQAVQAVVLSNHSTCTVVSFADRADTTTIKHADEGWTKFLSKVKP